MNKSIEKKYPLIRKGEAGYWHAYGNGWAVCAPTREEVKQKYQDMFEFINELISRPVVREGDIPGWRTVS